MPASYERDVGTYTGDTAAQTITLGYKPTFVMVVNETDGDAIWFHINGMTDANAFSIKDTGAGATDLALESSNAITLSDSGFTIGTDMSESGKTFRYVAFR